MTASPLRSAFLWLLSALAVWASNATHATIRQERPAPETRQSEEDEDATVQIHYLEIVTPAVNATCKALGELHGVTFGAPAPELGNARTAQLRGGGLVGVRAPLRPDEEPVVRPYVLVTDLAAAVEEASSAGGEIALPPTEIAGRGQCAIYVQGGIEHGLWQL